MGNINLYCGTDKKTESHMASALFARKLVAVLHRENTYTDEPISRFDRSTQVATTIVKYRL